MSEAGTYLGWMLAGAAELSWRSLAEVYSGELDHPWRRLGWLIVVLPLVWIKLAVDGVCLLLDEVLFPRAKQTSLDGMVMVLGPPRSGTTFLHRVLAEDRRTFVTSPAWEVFLAPSICQKRFLRAIRSVDRRLGSPLIRLIRWGEGAVLRAFEDTHPGSLLDPEEDYFYLGSVCACTGWQLAFPAWRGIRKWMPGQPEMSTERRRQALAFYRACLQKQRYADVSQRCILSKNASFASWMDLLPEAFPEARFAVCMRDPVETLPSMLSTARASVEGVFAQGRGKELNDLLLEEMKAHYRVLHEVIPALAPGRAVVVAQQDVKQRLTDVIHTIDRELNLKLTEDFFDILREKDEASKNYKSRHHYDTTSIFTTVSGLRMSCPTLPPTALDPSHDSTDSEHST
jgi:hypothetical protein